MSHQSHALQLAVSERLANIINSKTERPTRTIIAAAGRTEDRDVPTRAPAAAPTI
jgi:hypothetical protein